MAIVEFAFVGSKAVVELYNHFREGSRSPGNGYYVARYVDGRRTHTLKDFGRDEAGARAYAELWNGPASE